MSVFLPPWHLPGRVYYGREGFSQEILDFVRFMDLTPQERFQRVGVICQVTDIVKKLWSDVEVELFGSWQSGLCLPCSDVDISICNTGTITEVTALIDALETNGYQCKFLANAKIPIVKFRHPQSGIHGDISFSTANASQSAELVKQLLLAFPAARPMIIVLKAYLRAVDLNNVYTGGLSSYTITLLVISFLQHHPYTKYPEGGSRYPLSDLLIDFLAFYGKDFNYNSTTISILNGGKYEPKSKNWTDPEKPHLLSVIDPLDQTNDVSRGSFAIARVRSHFYTCYVRLQYFKTQNPPSMLSTILDINGLLQRHILSMEQCLMRYRLFRAMAAAMSRACNGGTNGGSHSQPPMGGAQLAGGGHHHLCEHHRAQLTAGNSHHHNSNSSSAMAAASTPTSHHHGNHQSKSIPSRAIMRDVHHQHGDASHNTPSPMKKQRSPHQPLYPNATLTVPRTKVDMSHCTSSLASAMDGEDDLSGLVPPNASPGSPLCDRPLPVSPLTLNPTVYPVVLVEAAQHLQVLSETAAQATEDASESSSSSSSSNVDRSASQPSPTSTSSPPVRKLVVPPRDLRSVGSSEEITSATDDISEEEGSRSTGCSSGDRASSPKDTSPTVDGSASGEALVFSSRTTEITESGSETPKSESAQSSTTTPDTSSSPSSLPSPKLFGNKGSLGECEHPPQMCDFSHPRMSSAAPKPTVPTTNTNASGPLSLNQTNLSTLSSEISADIVSSVDTYVCDGADTFVLSTFGPSSTSNSENPAVNLCYERFAENSLALDESEAAITVDCHCLRS